MSAYTYISAEPQCREPPANFGVKLSAGWCPARGPSRLQKRKLHGGTPAAVRDSVLRTSFAAAVAPRRSLHVKPAAAYTKDVSPTNGTLVVMSEDESLYGWSARDAANRATQSLYVLAMLVSTKDTRPSLADLARQTAEQLALITRTYDDHQCRDCYTSMRSMFFQLLSVKPVPIWSAPPERIWEMFLACAHFPAAQIRANIKDIAECFDLPKLAGLFKRDPKDLCRLPVSSELVLSPGDEGIRCELLIPAKQLVVDMLLMLEHARTTHGSIAAAVTHEAGVVGIEYDVRLDTYVRLVLLLAVTACEAVINEYVHVICALLRARGFPKTADELENMAKRGVTLKVRKLVPRCAEVLGATPPEAVLIDDLAAIIEIRNRIVHADGRGKSWDAMNLHPSAWSFSQRLREHPSSSFAIPRSHIGNEMRLASFTARTTVEFIDSVHRILYPDDRSAIWLDIARPLGRA